MSEDQSTTPPVLAQDRPGPPPLRIHHVLVWMAVAAVSFTFYRLFLVEVTPEWYSSSLKGYGGAVAMSAIGLIIQAAGITLFLFAVYWRRKGVAVFRGPGEWLLCAFPYSIIEPAFTHLIFPAVFTTLFNQQPWHDYRLVWELGDIARALFWTCGFLLQLGIPTAFFGWCAWKIADSLVWRLVFASFCLGLMAWQVVMFFAFDSMTRTAPGYFMAVYVFVPSYFAAILATSAIASDYLTARPRSWLHWAGAGLFALSQWWVVLTSLVWWFII
jgi:hypothetical protein